MAYFSTAGRAAFWLAGLVLLTSCTERVRTMDAAVQAGHDKAANLLTAAKTQSKPREVDNVRFSDQVYMQSKGFRLRNGEALPIGLNAVTVRSSKPGHIATLAEAAAALARAAGRPVVLDGFEADEPVAAAAPTGSLPPPPPLSGAAQNPAAQTLASQLAQLQPTKMAMELNFVDRPITEVLDAIDSNFGTRWEYRDEVFHIQKMVTKIFPVRMPQGKVEISNGIQGSTSVGKGGGSGDSTSEGGAKYDFDLKAQSDVWNDVEKTLREILPKDSKVIISSSSSTVTVRTAPWAIDLVQEYIDTQNAILSRQITLEIQVYAMSLNQDEVFGTNFLAKYLDVEGIGTASLAGPAAPLNATLANAVGKFSGGIINPPSPAAATPWNGSNALFQALSTDHNVAQVESIFAYSRNNQAVNGQKVLRKAYVKASKTTNTQSNSATELTPGAITTGLIYSALPHVSADGTVSMYLSLSLSKEVNMVSASSNGTTIQLPSVQSRDFNQSVELKPNATLVLTANEGKETGTDRSGLVDPSFWGLGGGFQGSGLREVLIITVTPIVSRL